MSVRKVRPKQTWRPPAAVDYNAMAAAADAYRQGPARTPERPQPVEPDVIMVRNDSGADQRRGDVLAITSTKLLTAVNRERIWVSATKLTSANRNSLVAVLLDPLPAGKIGPAQLAGAGVAYVNVAATWHRRAYPAAGSNVLRSGLFGPLEILSTPAATGEQMCNVRIEGDNRTVFAESRAISGASYSPTTGTLRLGSGVAKILVSTGNAGSYQRVNSRRITVYNPTCEPIDVSDPVILYPSDDWLPLACRLCDVESSDSSSESSSSEPSSSEPSESGSEPSESGSEPSESGSEPSESGSEPSESGSEPSESGSEPSDSEPSESGSEPSESGSEPSDSEPSESGSEPSDSEPSESGSEPSESGSLTSSASSENPCGQCWFVFTDTGEPCTMGGGLETGEWVLVDNCKPGYSCPSGGPEECGTYYGEIRGGSYCEE